MLKKKNIAMAMAAATAVTAVAPATQVFANVVDNTQAEEIKALKEKVYGVLNAKYTENPNLLTTTTLKGERVYDEVTILVNNVAISDATSGVYSNYAAFENAFDKAFNKMVNGDVLKVQYKEADNKPVNEIIEGEISDSKAIEYKLPEFPNEVVTNKDLNDVVNAVITYGEDVQIGGITVIDGDDGKEVTVNAVDKKISVGYNADGTTYAKIPVTNGYITVKDEDDQLDLSKPKFKVVDGYYVDAAGNSIKKFIQSEELQNIDGGDFVAELKALGGVVEGYYPVIKEDEVETKTNTVAIVKNSQVGEKVGLTVGDLYEASTDRLTKTGNEILRAIERIMEDEASEEADQVDNLRAKIITLDAAGEVIDTIDTEVIDGVNDGKLPTEQFINNEVASIKVRFESTKNEQSADDKDWELVYEATITEGRNEKFENLERAFDNLLEMPMAAGMNRYATAAETSRLGWTGENPLGEQDKKEVVLVSGASEKLVDGLTATPLAATLNDEKGAPVLLTKQNELPQETLTELKRLGATHVTIVGGDSAVSKELESKLEKTYGLKVERLAGEGRYETSMAVANKMANIKAEVNNVTRGNEAAKFNQVFVVGGRAEADALSASAIAAKLGSPILLTPSAELDTEVKHFINKNVKDTNKETDVFVVGGKSSVSPAVQNALVNIDVINDLGNKVEVKRLSGAEGTGRQDTNAAVIAEFANKEVEGELALENIVVAKSDNKGMIDALAAGAYAAHTGSHLVLATNELTEAQEDALVAVKKAIGTEETKQDADKMQVGYNVGSAVVKFVNKLFNRN